MGKRTDKLFHLTVAAFALTLATVSVGTVVYQNHPVWIEELLRGYHLGSNQLISSRSDANRPVPPTGNSVKPDTIGSTGKGQHNTTTGSANSAAGNQGKVTQTDLVGKPSFKLADNSRMVQIQGVGADTLTTDVNQIQTTIDKYGILNLVSQSLGMNVPRRLHILVAKSSADYQKALSSLGVSASSAKQYTQDTGGFAQGDTIVIPLYQNQTTADLANTLSHELTHAFLNMNVGNFPSWMNEGLAVTDGMTAQSRAAVSPVVYAGYARQMAESILSAEQQGKLLPLESDESKVLSGTAPYDLELQDWLAVRYLIETKGQSAFSNYFYRLNIGESEATAFTRSFGMAESSFNQDFANHLKQAVATKDSGVTMTFRVPSSFKGAIRFLQHGTTSWTGFRPTKGQTSIVIGPDGKIMHATQVTVPIEDSNPPDDTTLYINLDPSTPLTYQGQTVKNSGFAIDYHYGMYGFVNSWIALSNGKSFYFHTPTLFNVNISQIQEQKPNQWLVGLFAPLTSSSSVQTVPASAGTAGSGTDGNQTVPTGAGSTGGGTGGANATNQGAANNIAAGA